MSGGRAVVSRRNAWLSWCLCAIASASACASTRAPIVRAPSPEGAKPSLLAPTLEPLATPAGDAAPNTALPPELFVRCADAASCPAAVGMLVVAADPRAEPERCTVTLIGDDRVLTASPAPGSIVTVVSVTPHPVHGSTHALSTRLCRAIDSAPAERALGEAASNVGWLSSCPIARGNSGSPVLDYDGHVRALVHGGTSLTSAIGVTSAVSD